MQFSSSLLRSPRRGEWSSVRMVCVCDSVCVCNRAKGGIYDMDSLAG